MSSRLPESFRKIVGELPEPGTLDAGDAHPFETIEPASTGYVERDGVKVWYAVWGDRGPWIAFAPIYQIVHSRVLKATVPYLSRHFRVITIDGRGTGRSDRPLDESAYSVDEYYQDYVAVLDAVDADRVAAVAISVTTMTAVRLAAEQPERVSHLIVAGGFTDFGLDNPAIVERIRTEVDLLQNDYPQYLHRFFNMCFTEPHSTKQFEDSVRYAWSTTSEVLDLAHKGWVGDGAGELLKRIRCPRFEERDLMVEFGEQYRRYRASVGMLVPRLAGAERPQRSTTPRRVSDTAGV